MRFVSYNIEWFDALFDDDGRLLLDDGWSARRDVTRAQQAEAIATVLTALDADGLMVIEAPDTNRRRNSVRALQGFAEAFDLRARRAVTGYVNTTQQEIAFLYDPDRMVVSHSPQGLPDAPMRRASTQNSASTWISTRPRIRCGFPNPRWNWRWKPTGARGCG